VWEARSHLRSRPSIAHVSKHPHLHPFKLFAMDRFHLTTATQKLIVTFLIGPCFGLGSVLFVIGTISQMFRGYWDKTWPMHREDLAVNIPLMVSLLLILSLFHARTCLYPDMPLSVVSHSQCAVTVVGTLHSTLMRNAGLSLS
jgi:hypothetical protein